MEKITLVIGGSTRPQRYSYRAIESLVSHNIPVYAVGLTEGEVEGVRIEKPFPMLPRIHTITMYVSPANQPFYYDFIRQIKPTRIIFNPGTENESFMREMKESGVEIVIGCTLIMLSVGTY
jgi:predicted CoA-binding protein